MREVAQYTQVDALLMARNSPRSITCATSVARMTIAKRLQKRGGSCAVLHSLRGGA